MSTIKLLEEDILISFCNSNVSEECEVSFVKDLDRGKFLSILNSPLCEEIFKERLKTRASDESLETILLKCVECCLDQYASDSVKQLEVLCIGVAGLLGFIQENWTGPSLTSDGVVLSWITQACQDEASQGLDLDDASCVATVNHPELLILARATLRVCSNWLTDLPTGCWWWARTLFIHQEVLDEFSPTLHTALMELLKESAFNSMCCSLGARTHALLQLEAARIYLHYTQVLRSKEHFNAALKFAGMKMELIGALGRRTRFQQQDLAQLTLKVEVDNPDMFDKYSVSEQQHLPKNLRLQDEVRLDQIKFTSEADGKIPDLTPIHQAVVLGMYVQTTKCQPLDGLMKEELLPYLEFVLNTPQWWSLQTTALSFRCRLEAAHSRTVERALMQMQALVDCISQQEPEAKERLWGVFFSHLPPRWQLEADLARYLINLGAVNSALDVYLRLQMWEEVIQCYHMLNLRHKAEEVVRQELAKHETAKLWCMLGDATDDPKHYEQAWELSNHTSGRAQRHWGQYYYARNQYEESIPHFRLSLECNSLQVSVWLRLGFAALMTQDWETCAKAYRRYCSLDSENFEAWNNLSKAYIKMGQKARAWKTLQEALKCNYENWRVWDNNLLVSTDCAEFEEVIRAYHRILDLKGKHVDTEVLSILTRAVGQNLLDSRGLPAGRLMAQALGLFGHLTGMVTDNAEVWRLYAELTASAPEQTPQTLQKTVQHLQKAHRCAVQSANWHMQLATCKEVIKLCSTLADTYLQCCRVCPEPQQALSMLSSAKFSLKGVITKVKQEHTDLCTGSLPTDLVQPMSELEERLEKILAEADLLRE